MPSPQFWSQSTQTRLSNSPEVNALLSGKRWKNSEISYSFPETDSVWSTSFSLGYGPNNGNGEPWHTDFQPLQDTDRAYFNNAVQQWGNVAHIDFIEIKETADSVGDIRAAYTSNENLTNTQAWAYEPADTAYAGDIWFNNNGSSSTEFWTPGSYEFMTVMHELGHAIGLKHPFEASDTNSTTLPASLDSRSYTIMSYSAHAGLNDTFFSYEPTSLMMLDISAIQYIYGANYEYNAGNDVYQYTDATPYHHTIWDGGGVDTIQYDGNQKSIIDLRSGYGSKIGIDVYLESSTNQEPQTVNNIWIAQGVAIENATGGQNDDQLIGNELDNTLNGQAGNDIVMGGAGHDVIDGGAGLDTAIYTDSFSLYTITRAANTLKIQSKSDTDGTDTVSNLERVQFSDAKLALDLDGHAGQVSKILGAVFSAESVTDKNLVGIGLQYLDSGTSYTDLTQKALDARLGAGFSDQAEIQLLFQNLLGIEPNQDEVNYWTEMINTGHFTQASLATMAADLDLNAQNINLVGLSQTGIEFL